MRTAAFGRIAPPSGSITGESERYMNYRLGLLLTGLLLSPFACGQGVRNEKSVAQMFSDFERKLNNVDAWKSSNAKDNDLDLMLLATKAPGFFRKTADGKLLVIVRQHQLPVEIRTEFPRFSLPVLSFVAPGPTDGAGIAAAGKLRDDVNAALEKMDAPCGRVSENRQDGQVQLSCEANPMQFLNYLMNVQVAECTDDGAAQCARLDGQRYKLRHLPKGKFTPTPLWDNLSETFAKMIAEGGWTAIDEEGNKVSKVNIDLRGPENQSPLIVMPRVLYEKLDTAQRARWVLLGPISANDIAEQQVRLKLSKLLERTSNNNAAAAAQRKVQDTTQTLARMPAASTSLAALKLVEGNDGSVCTIGTRAEGRNVVDSARSAVLATEDFRSWSNAKLKRGFDHVKPDLDGLFTAMRTRNCTIVIDTVSNVAELAKDLMHEGVKVEVLNKSFGHEAMANAGAQATGFANDADVKLANSLGLTSGASLKIFREAGLGDKASLDAALRRMKATQYSGSDSDVLQFVRDEQDGAKRKMSAADVRYERYKVQAAKDPFHGLTPLAASYKALAVLKARAKDQSSESVARECASQIAKAERETADYLKPTLLNVAKDYCTANAR
jgi:hypothetical protein